MRPLPILLAVLACALPAAADEQPKHLRVSVQFIEMPHPAMTGLLADKDTTGPAAHQQAMSLVKDGKAKLLESCMVICRSGQKATVETVREVIFPTEYKPPGWVPLPASELPPSPRPHAATPTAFETRNTGVTFEVEPTLNADDHTVDLRFVPEVVAQIGIETSMEFRDEWGDASIRWPVFESWKSNTGMILMAGQFELVAAITPKHTEPAPAAPRRLLVFVRADVVPVSP